MEDIQSGRPPLWRLGVTEVWRLAQLVTAFTVLYGAVINVVNMVSGLLAGPEADATIAETLAATLVATPALLVTVPLSGSIAEFFIACIVTGITTYFVWKWICNNEWVQEKVDVEKCWEEVKWYNPFSWFVAIVCTVVEVLKWVLKLICGWVEVLVVVLTLSCMGATLLIVLA